MNIVSGSEKNPVKVRLPFYIHITPAGELEFQTLDVTSNLDTTDISATYKKILTPQISVTIEGKTYPFNTSEIDKMLTSKMPDVLLHLRSQLGDFSKRTLPDMLNKKAKEYLTGALEQIQDMSPPGADDGDKRPNFKWGVNVASIDLKKSLNISLHSYIEDTLTPAVPLDPTYLSRGVPQMNALPMENYDVGLAVDRGVINRVLQLAFLRKNFEKIAQSDGTTFTLGKAPTIDYAPAMPGITLKPQETLVKMHVSMEQRPNRNFVKDVIYIELDLIARLTPVKGGMQLIIMKLDTDSAFMDPKYLTTAGTYLPGVSSIVKSTIKEQVQKISDAYEKHNEAIPGVMPLPPEILGAKFDINRVNMDPNGQLVMYLNYAAGTFPATVTTATAAPVAKPATVPAKPANSGGKK